MTYNITASEKKTFRNMIDATKRCIQNKGIDPHNLTAQTFDAAVDCETVYFSEDDKFTYHTHPNGDPRPSEIDKITTNKYKKKFMLIGLVPQKKVVVYAAPRFDNIVGSFNV